ncbi:hypothetical protein ABEB36_008413 [Hypothenemus hampei]|uniref:Uncharacterized protein n=1 Tax=Hypothenemus hampei TaxID=57062 RepID=A0ABD1EMB6_HYPHA
MESIFAFGIFGQFFFSTIGICFVAMYLILPMNTENDTTFVQYLTGAYALIYMFLDITLYCIFGHLVISESLSVSSAIYSSNWYDIHPMLRKDLIVFRESARIPATLTVGKLFPLTFETLIKLLRITYSFFACLKASN